MSSLLSRCAARLRASGFAMRPALRLTALGAAGFLLLPLATRANDPGSDLPLRVLIVGGGPDLANNQVAIESNVRYVGKLLPAGTTRTTLFSDGDPNHATVLYDDDTHEMPVGERILSLLSPYPADDASSHYRKPNLGVSLDGASRLPDVSKAFGQIAQEESADPGAHRLLLYFTGHGSPGRRDYENNVYDLWDESRNPALRDTTNLSVRELAKQIARVPNDVPITVVMVQCFSGAFGNLLFEGGDPRGDMIKRDLCGFYATVNDRVAAGCTSAINEAEYRDFTSFFFAALTGRDRVGRRVTGADFRSDGRIGGDEAFCYALIHDDSIDVPVCTSDVFLRRYAPLDNREVFQTPYASVRSWASLPQRAALDALSDRLRLGGNNRLTTAYSMLAALNNPRRRPSGDARDARERLKSIQNDGKASLLRQFPDLKLSNSAARREARQDAIAQLTREARQGKWKDLLDADDTLDKAEQNAEKQEVADSQVIRLVRLAKSVVLAHHLRESSEAGLKARFARLLDAEARPILPPAGDVIPRETAEVKAKATAATRSHAASQQDCGCSKTPASAPIGL